MPFSLKSLQAVSARDYFAILNDDSAKISYAQMGEDITVFHLMTRLVKKLDKGFFVDVGAFHPRHFSNTKFLNMTGWRGINIDASEESIAAFNAERPDDINVCCGIAPEEGEVTFYKFAGAAASTICPEQAKYWQDKLGWQIVGTSTVHVQPLNTVLERFIPSRQPIDYMNIDLEGMDGRVVKSLDFDRFRPKVLTIELHDVNKLALGEDEAIAHIIAQGYSLKAMNLMTFAFVETEYDLLG